MINAFLEVVPGTERNQGLCPGDFGAPLFFQDQIAGIASFRFVATCPESGADYFVAVPHVRAWIRDTLNDLDPPGACALNDDAAFMTAEGGCKDLAASKIWSRASPDKLTQPNGISYCYGLEEGGRTDWRPPTVAELQALDAHGGKAHLKLVSPVWSATAAPIDPDRAFLFSLGSHTAVERLKSAPHDVICVRDTTIGD